MKKAGFLILAFGLLIIFTGCQTTVQESKGVNFSGKPKSTTDVVVIVNNGDNTASFQGEKEKYTDDQLAKEFEKRFPNKKVLKVTSVKAYVEGQKPQEMYYIFLGNP